MISENVYQKLVFAQCRLNDIEALIKDNRLAADPDTRQQLTQEFFFHLVGATEYLAQFVNERRQLNFQPENVAVHKIAKKLKKLDPSDLIVAFIEGLCADTKKNCVPPDPYSDEGLIYRIINYRNEVVHRNINPFHFVMSEGPKVAYFWLDPRDHNLGLCTHTVDVDLSNMYLLVEQQCRNVLNVLA
jgi:hypothetical protein